ncbi:LLM class flavin-dependent oxidoreductase [Rhodococcus opacus]|uniref:LLM class flavin-dependent oxidoreductase n=1 Tax=Rhodococcus opacus TaxID=37919 RepID=UPI000FFC56A5
MSLEFLWYIPNQVTPGHRGDAVTVDHNSLDTLTAQAKALEEHGWKGALIGTGWGRPDTLTVAAALAARTATFEPLIAIRPGYWRPAHFASAVATLDHLTGGRVRINIVSGKDNLGAYGEHESDQAHRYARTKEFLQLVRKLWTEENVTFRGEHFQVTDSTVLPRISPHGGRLHPKLYFGGASEAAEHVAATEADVQLFWGEPLVGVQERIERLRSLSEELGREHAPLEFGLRITTFVRDTTEQAWAEAEAKVAEMAKNQGAPPQNPHRPTAATPRPGYPWRRTRRQPVHRTRKGRWRRRRHHLARRLPGGRREVAAQVPGSGHHPLRALRHPVSAGDRASGQSAPAVAARMSRGSATCASRNSFEQTVTATRPRCRRERVTGCHRLVALSHNESRRTKHAGIFSAVRVRVRSRAHRVPR